MAETLFQLQHSPSQKCLPNANEAESYNCDVCGKQIDRKYIPFLKKYVFPVCRCVTLELEKEQERQERLKRRQEMEKIFRQNLMNERLKTASFESFIPRDGTESFLDEVKKFVQEFPDREFGLLGYGDPGNGKSHLFVSAHHYLDYQGHVCLFLEVPRLLNLIDDAKKYKSNVGVNDIINAAIHCDLLTLDELGAGKITQEEFTDVLFPIINGRQGKLTNYTTNLDLDELRAWFATDKYGKPLDDKGRLIDRILGSCDIIQNEGASKRQEDAIARLQGGKKH